MPLNVSLEMGRFQVSGGGYQLMLAKQPAAISPQRCEKCKVFAIEITPLDIDILGAIVENTHLVH